MRDVLIDVIAALRNDLDTEVEKLTAQLIALRTEVTALRNARPVVEGVQQRHDGRADTLSSLGQSGALPQEAPGGINWRGVLWRP